MDVYEAILTTVATRPKTKEQIIRANSAWTARVVTAALHRLRVAGVVDRDGDIYLEAGTVPQQINKAAEPVMTCKWGEEIDNSNSPNLLDPGLPGGGSILDDGYQTGRFEAWEILREAGVA